MVGPVERFLILFYFIYLLFPLGLPPLLPGPTLVGVERPAAYASRYLPLHRLNPSLPDEGGGWECDAPHPPDWGFLAPQRSVGFERESPGCMEGDFAWCLSLVA